MTTLTINLTDIEELKDVQTLIQFQIDKLQKAEEKWEIERKLKKKKVKTIEEIIEEINEDIQYEQDTIIDANIEIQNLELKREEVEKMEKDTIVSPPILKKIKKILKIKKKEVVVEPDLIDY